MFKRKFILVTFVCLALGTGIACSTITLNVAPDLSSVTATPDVATTPSALIPPTGGISPSATTPPSGTTSSNANVSAIQNVIQKTNQEQVQALSAQDPTVMRDTSTTTFYQQSVQTLNDLLNNGVTSIQLVNLKWGPVTLKGASTAQATTYETWSTTFSDGSTMQETDTNIYTLVLNDGVWKVQDDQHPNTNNQPSTSTNPSGGTSSQTPVPPAGAATGQSESRNWSGYVAIGGTFTSVSGTWTVPNVSADTTGTDATWIGIGGVASTDLIQAGTQAIVENGQVMYSAIWETLPETAQPIPMTINAGDQINVSITQQKSDKWQINIQDATNGQSWTKSVTYRSSLSSAEWIEEAPASGRLTILPLDSFGSVTFTSATTVENGQTSTIAQTGAKPLAMDNGAGQVLAQASNLDANGTGFTVTRTSVPAPSVSPFHRRRPGG